MILFNPQHAKESVNTAIDEIRYIMRATNLPVSLSRSLEDAERDLLEAHDEIARCARNPERYSGGNGD